MAAASRGGPRPGNQTWGSPPWCSAGLVTLRQELWSQCAVTADQQQTPQDQSRVRFSPNGCTSALEALPRTGVSISPNLPGSPGEQGLSPCRSRSVGLREAAPYPMLPGVSAHHRPEKPHQPGPRQLSAPLTTDAAITLPCRAPCGRGRRAVTFLQHD